MNDETAELDWLRELAFFTLAGAQLFSSDTTYLVSSCEIRGNPRPEPVWVTLAAGLLGVLTLGYVLLHG